ncbi:hypothetical protein D3C85_760070 [compost metagenome]
MIKPIENAKDGWKFSTVQLSAVGFAIMGVAEAANQAWVTLPPEVQALVPMTPTVGWIIFGLTMVSRFFTLTGKNKDEASS